MKEWNRMGIVLLCAAAVAAPPLMSAQAGGSMPSSPSTPASPSSTPGMSGMSDATTSTATGDPATQEMKDRLFVQKAAEGGMAEIQFGQLAAQKGGSDEVKQFGQRMVSDHTMLNEGMKPVAEQLGAKAPTKLNKKDQAEYDKLNALSGADFDKEYLSSMVKDHKQDLQEFQMEGSMTQNPNLKAALDKSIPVIQQHLQMVSQIANEKGVPTGKSGRPAGN